MSKKIAAKKSQPYKHMPLHDKLHNQTLTKYKYAQMKERIEAKEKERREEAKKRTVNQPPITCDSKDLSPANRVFVRGQKMTENRDRFVQYQRLTNEQKEIEQCTFRPQYLSR